MQLMQQQAIAQALAPTASEWGSSRFGEWRRCGKAHDLRYRLRVVARPRPADDMGAWEIDSADYLHLGSLCHSVLRYVQECAMGIWPDCDPADWPQVLKAWEARQADPAAAWEIAGDAATLMTAYWDHYGYANGGWPEGVEILGVEVPLSVRSGVLGPLPYTATADTILRMPGGEIVIADHKTRGRTLPPDRQRYVSGLRTRPQFAGLSWLVQQGGFAPDAAPPAVWVNYLIKPTKTLGPRFERLFTRMDQRTLDGWAQAQTATAYAMADISSQRDPVADWSQCAPEIGPRCWAFEYCHGSDESRERHYRTLDSAAPAAGEQNA